MRAPVPLLATLLSLLFPVTLVAQSDSLPRHLRDRGRGIPTSMFGTYIDRGELLLYPFFEYYRDRDAEYSPDELGFGLDHDFRGRYRASEGLLFVGYGVSDRLALEIEAAVISAQLEKASDDPSPMPAVIEESGLGDVEAQLRWRWRAESTTRPEAFSYFETVFPFQKSKRLIGTQDWELKLGSGLIRGFAWGTMTVRAAVEYDGSAFALGEYALEYLRRLGTRVHGLLAVEGTEDEVELITEWQWQLTRGLTLKLNNAFALTSKATDWAPEVGLMFSFRK
jgi:hypothetical protein